MIVQSAADNAPHFIMTMDQHTALSVKFAEHFGNKHFDPIEPREQMLYVTAHHDAGWKDLDKQARCDPETGLPYDLVQTPFEHIIATSKASPDFNGANHPYCELLSSMHSWGLYNGRYGISDKVLLDSLAADNRIAADAMLDGELLRQEHLKAVLSSDAKTATWVEETHLFQNYKQLQFFDTLALYFNCVPQGDRREACFAHVPMSATLDTNIDIKPVGGSIYAMTPYPFDHDRLELSFQGLYLAPSTTDEQLRAALAHAPLEEQTIRLVDD